MKLGEKFGNWKSGIKLHKEKKYLITAGCFLAVYIALIGFAAWFEEFSAADAAIIAGIAVVSLAVFLFRVPVHALLRFIVGLAIPFALFWLIEQYTHEISDLVENSWRLNLALYYLLFGIFFCVSGSLGIADAILTGLIMVCGIANYFVMLFRSAPIVPWDFYSLGTAMSVAGNQTFMIDWKFALLTAGFMGIFLLSLKLNIHLKRWPVRVPCILALAVAGGFYLNYLWDPETPAKEGLNKSLFKTVNMYKKDGFVLAFTMNLRYLTVDEPEGYDKAAAREILASQQADTAAVPDEEFPNVIIIMSETFSDPAVNGAFETNQDYMPFIRSLLDGAENTVSGDLYVSVLGGNTANSEYEFLTGNSMQFFPPGSVAYQQYLHKDILSVVDSFNSWGYATVGMHPYRAGGWNRNKIYPLMHFDDTLFISDVKYRSKLRVYVSDEANYQDILWQMDQYSEPLFLMNVTMQNHSAYGGSYDNFDPQVQAIFKNTKSNKYLNNYLSLLYETDIATEKLIETLKESDEKTVVLFFGDHQPNDYVVKPIFKEYGIDIENRTLEEEQKRHITPFFIWANYDIEEQSGITTSANYLCNLLLETIGFPKNDYQTYLDTIQETFPVFNAIGYFDAEGNCRDYTEMTPEEREVYESYEKVQYYRVFDQFEDMAKNKQK